jgi:hypothetical protein
MKKQTHKQTVFTHLQTRGSITKCQAFTLYHMLDLATYIKLLRREGVNITTEMQVRKDENGKQLSTWALYKLNK